MADETVTLSAHDAAMIAKVDAAHAASTGPTTPTAAAPVRPDHIPEKFWDADKGVAKVDELAKSYAELEKARGKAPEAVPPVVPPAPVGTPDGSVDEAAAAAEAAAKAAGGDTSKVDFAALSASFAVNGSLSTEEYAQLESSGLSRDLVDQFIAGQTAVANAQIAEAHALAGGDKHYSSMVSWAMSNLPPAEQTAFDKAVIGDAATRKQAIVALKAQYQAAMGSDPTLVQGGAGGNSDAGAYQSRAEVTADMRDPRYKSDPAFRAVVERKLAISSVF